jgi:hypothetical protein
LLVIPQRPLFVIPQRLSFVILQRSVGICFRIRPRLNPFNEAETPPGQSHLKTGLDGGVFLTGTQLLLIAKPPETPPE